MLSKDYPNQKLANKISDQILQVARLFNDVDNTDLQALSETAALNIIQDCKLMLATKEMK